MEDFTGIFHRCHSLPILGGLAITESLYITRPEKGPESGHLEKLVLRYSQEDLKRAQSQDI